MAEHETPSVNGYTLASKQDFLDFVSFCNQDDWNLCYENDDVKVWDKSDPDSAINIVKLYAKLSISAGVCYDVLHDPDYRKTWDENMHEGYNIEVLDSFNDVGYYSAKSPFFGVAGRDFCNQRSWWVDKENSQYFIINHSVEHKDCPVHKPFVRARSIRTGYWIRPDPNNDEHCVIVYMTQTDIMGMIPTWIVNKATKTFAPKLVENLLRVGPTYTEWKSTHNPEDKPWRAENEKYWWEEAGTETTTKVMVTVQKGEDKDKPEPKHSHLNRLDSKLKKGEKSSEDASTEGEKVKTPRLKSPRSPRSPKTPKTPRSKEGK